MRPSTIGCGATLTKSTTLTADARAVPLPDGSADVVTCAYLLQLRSGRYSASVPFLVQAPERARLLVVVPAITWLGVDKVDHEKREIFFHASGSNPGQDPYYVHYARINFDGTGLTWLTQADGTHKVAYSPDGSTLATAGRDGRIICASARRRR